MDNFDFNLSLVLGHSILFEAKQQVPDGVVDDFRNDGVADVLIPGGIPDDDPKPPSPAKATQQQIQALIKYFPQLQGVINEQILPTSQAQLAAAQATEPGFAQLAQQTQRSNATSAAETDKSLLSGSGGDIVRMADALSRGIDPEFYQVREQAAQGLGELFKPVSGGELSAIERGLNQQNQRSGNLDVPSNTQTISNALTYGNAARDKLGQALQQATAFLPVSRTGVDVLQQATQRPSNALSTQAVKSGLGDQTFGSAQGLLGQVGETQRLGIEANQGRRTGAEKIFGSIDY